MSSMTSAQQCRRRPPRGLAPTGIAMLKRADAQGPTRAQLTAALTSLDANPEDASHLMCMCCNKAPHENRDNEIEANLL